MYHSAVTFWGYHAFRWSGRGHPSMGRRSSVSQEVQQHVALPKLYGQPAYARPPRVVAEQERPFDPDELPLAIEMTEEERVVFDGLPAQPYPADGHEAPLNGHDGSLSPRPLRLKKLAARILGGE
jgi:hypothetical protein